MKMIQQAQLNCLRHGFRFLKHEAISDVWRNTRPKFFGSRSGLGTALSLKGWQHSSPGQKLQCMCTKSAAKSRISIEDISGGIKTVESSFLQSQALWADANADEESLSVALRLLHQSARSGEPEAQYFLGCICLDSLEINKDEKKERITSVAAPEASSSMEDTFRRNRSNNEGLEKVTRIRKNARRQFQTYLAQKERERLLKMQQQQAHLRKTSDLVQRTNKEQLDITYGKFIDELLDPSMAIDILSDESTEGENLPTDQYEGIKWIRRAADAGLTEARVKLGNLCMHHKPVLGSYAISWYRSVVEDTKTPHPDALYNLGMLYYEGIPDCMIARDLKKAMTYFMQAAEAHDASAQYWLGHTFRVGCPEVDLPQCTTTALLYLQQAANQGHSGAQFYLARLYYNGDEDSGIPSDRSKFLAFLRLATDNPSPDAEALYCLGEMYLEGVDGVEKDLNMTISYFKKAASLENVDALCALGSMYYNGLSVPQNYAMAFHYYQIAADLNSLPAWKNLAHMYLNGQGVAKNVDTATSIIEMLELLSKEVDK